MKKLSFLLPLVGVALISSCSQEEISTVTQNRHNPIKFQAAVTSRVNSEFDYATSAKLRTFYVTSFVNSHKAVD